ncbi:hypothetical protein CORC01_01123 [Colletotrichum orchidophilum]|uniref:Uncharacterized protein n=1 Tax=Colletotrichum orchidophilum TaxID=1209926 RepID=A0A1G4BPQ8_9PEZI|nr:uncharacterized protein CORC01_01123 [Colletotrichum orchidophilum]OHF03404.1 hypothetical protein CORC01_01123 [Colletotrichum orchidophilum]
MEAVASFCISEGLNTGPGWARPFGAGNSSQYRIVATFTKTAPFVFDEVLSLHH